MTRDDLLPFVNARIADSERRVALNPQVHAAFRQIAFEYQLALEPPRGLWDRLLTPTWRTIQRRSVLIIAKIWVDHPDYVAAWSKELD